MIQFRTVFGEEASFRLQVTQYDHRQYYFYHCQCSVEVFSTTYDCDVPVKTTCSLTGHASPDQDDDHNQQDHRDRSVHFLAQGSHLCPEPSAQHYASQAPAPR
jgi:hypothetical protein